MARVLGIDLDALSPARPGARITTADVQRRAAAAAGGEGGSEPRPYSPAPTAPASTTAPAAPAQPAPAAAPSPSGVPFHRQPLTRVQKLAAARMTASARDIPQFSVSVDAEAGRLLKARQELAGLGLKASLTAMLIYLTARALADHPLLNAQYDQDEVIVYEQVNLGVAVSAPGGLAAPVIHRAGERTLGETAAELESMAQAARDGRLSPDQVSGATFTLSNLGMYGVREFVPLVNPPQAAILGVGAARPAALPTPDWGLRAAQLITLTVSADHRVLDGEAVARFLDTLRQRIENPDFISTRS
jgi:pyruvate dehydrogenase E2 component (dihydrolipoamide acetyltransferase)